MSKDQEPTRAAHRSQSAGVVRAQHDPVLQREVAEHNPKNDVFAPPHYTKDAAANQVPSPPPESLSADELRQGPRIYHQWPFGNETAMMDGLSDRVLASLYDAQAVDGLDSSTGRVHPGVSGDATVQAVVDATIASHTALWADWPDACEIVDPRLPVSVVPSLGEDEDPLEAAYEALLNETLNYHRPVPYDPDSPIHNADRMGLVVGHSQRFYALRGAWRDYRVWVQDLAPGGQYAVHMSHSCALAANGFRTPRCAEHTGGEFLVIHRSRFLVAMPVCRFCKETLIARHSPGNAIDLNEIHE